MLSCVIWYSYTVYSISLDSVTSPGPVGVSPPCAGYNDHLFQSMVFELTQWYFSSVAGNLLRFWWVWDWISGDMQYDWFEIVRMNTVPVGTVWLVQDLSLSHNLELTVILCSPVWYDVVLLLPVKMIKQNDFPQRMSHDKHREHVSWRLMWSCHIIFPLYEWHICINMTHHTVVTYRERAPCCS